MNLYDIHLTLMGCNAVEHSYTVSLAFSRKRCSESLTFDGKHTKSNLLAQGEIPLTDKDGLCIGYCSSFELAEFNTVRAKLMFTCGEFWRRLYSKGFWANAQLAGTAVSISKNVRTGMRQIEIAPKALVILLKQKPEPRDEQLFAGAMKDVRRLVQR